MREFFKGWKRKMGSVTLALACTLMVGWIRSFSVADRLVFEDAHFLIESQFGRIDWCPYGFEVPDTPIQWQTQDVRTIPPEYETADYRIYNHEIPYWSIVLPLTLLSAWLLFSTQPSVKRHAEPTKDQA